MELNLNPDRCDLRIFGLGGGAILTCVAFMLLYWQNISNGWTAGIVVCAIILAALAILSPGMLKWPYLVLTVAAFPLGVAVNFLILAVFYFLLLTPLALAMRLAGRKIIKMKQSPSAKTYWSTYTPPESNARYFNQF